VPHEVHSAVVVDGVERDLAYLYLGAIAPRLRALGWGQATARPTSPLPG
jgi:hypothetical protein